MLHLDIHELAALGADRVVVPVRHPVKAARTIAELYLRDVSRVFQEPQTIVNSRKTDARQQLFCAPEYLTRRQVAFRLADHLQHNLTLLRQSQILNRFNVHRYN